MKIDITRLKEEIESFQYIKPSSLPIIVSATYPYCPFILPPPMVLRDACYDWPPIKGIIKL